jgi:hypothetical protein
MSNETSSNPPPAVDSPTWRWQEETRRIIEPPARMEHLALLYDYLRPLVSEDETAGSDRFKLERPDLADRIVPGVEYPPAGETKDPS